MSGGVFGFLCNSHCFIIDVLVSLKSHNTNEVILHQNNRLEIMHF